MFDEGGIAVIAFEDPAAEGVRAGEVVRVASAIEEEDRLAIGGECVVEGLFERWAERVELVLVGGACLALCVEVNNFNAGERAACDAAGEREQVETRRRTAD